MSKEINKTIDIVTLVQNHPLTELPVNDTSILVDKIRNYFTNEEQRLFVANFYCYLNYNTKKDFIIDLDNIWKWIGFSQKIRAKELIINNFKENEDYKIEKPAFSGEKAGSEENFATKLAEASFTANSSKPKNEENFVSVGSAAKNDQNYIAEKVAFSREKATHTVSENGGLNKENIYLTVRCFKKLCLKAKTKKSDEIHEYYVKLEEIMNETISEQAKNLCNQLQIKDKQIKQIEDYNEETLILNFKNKQVIYVIKIEENIVKFGHAKDIKTRLSQHKCEFGPEIKLLFIHETVYNREFENMVKNDEILKKRIISREFKTNQTELIQMSDDFDIEKLKKRFEYIRNLVNGDLVNTLMKENEDLRNDNRILKEKLEEKNKVIANLYRLKIDDCNLPLTSINILTGEKQTFNTLSEAQSFHKADYSTIKHYIDKHHHLDGYIIHSNTKNYWMPPENFKFYKGTKRTTQNTFIKAVDKITGISTYYNSITEASLYLCQEIDNKEINGETHETDIIRKALGELMRGLPTKKQIINKYSWYKMKEIGHLIDENGNKTNIDEEIIENKENKITSEKIEESKPDEKMPIIVRNIKTGEEFTHPEGYSWNVFDKEYGITKETLINKFLNKQLDYKNFTFRTIGNPYWQPPENYISIDDGANVRLDYFIKITHKDTGISSYYTSVVQLCKNLFKEDEGFIKAVRKKLSKINPNSGSNTGQYSKVLNSYVWEKVKECGQLIKNN